jgi:hypothetical protein
VKLIFILRHPVDRAYSHYVMNCMKGYETHDFKRAIALEPERLRGTFPARLRFGYLDQGYYSKQIRRFLDYFPRSNMLVLLFEGDLIADRRAALKKVYSLLDVGESDINLDVWSYAGQTVSLTAFPFKERLGRWSLLRRMAKSGPLKGLRRLVEKPVPRKLDEATRRRLLDEHFARELEDLQGLIGRDLQSWSAAP